MTIGAIAILIGGREAVIVLTGYIVELIPLKFELGLEEHDTILPSATFGLVRTGLGLCWDCLEQSSTSKVNGLVDSGPE